MKGISPYQAVKLQERDSGCLLPAMLTRSLLCLVHDQYGNAIEACMWPVVPGGGSELTVPLANLVWNVVGESAEMAVEVSDHTTSLAVSFVPPTAGTFAIRLLAVDAVEEEALIFTVTAWQSGTPGQLTAFSPCLLEQVWLVPSTVLYKVAEVVSYLSTPALWCL